MRLLLLVLPFVGLVLAKEFKIQPSDSKVPACVEARCAEDEVCLLRHDEANCVKNTDVAHFIKSHQSKHHPKALHSHHEKVAKQTKCSSAELSSMGGRLLQWFTDMHQLTAGVDKALPAHTVTCRRDVAWMFEQWDGNQDGHLDKDELAPLENGGGEKCTAQFIDKCDDMVVDGVVSIDEWCDCFTFSDDVRHEPPCHQSKHSVDPHVPGVYLPRCDLEGFYRAEQCHGGECWCVDRFGREFDQSRVKGQLPDCGQYASELGSNDKKQLEAEL